MQCWHAKIGVTVRHPARSRTAPTTTGDRKEQIGTRFVSTPATTHPSKCESEGVEQNLTW